MMVFNLELMKFQFMSMSLSYFTSLNMLKQLRDMNADTTSAAIVSSADAAIWSVTLDAQTEEGPFQVKVTHPLANGTLETIILNDVLFGDVWVCVGHHLELQNMLL